MTASSTSPTIDRYTVGQNVFHERQPFTQISTKTNPEVVACYKTFIAYISQQSTIQSGIRVRPADTDSYWILWKRIEDESKEININRHRWVFFRPVVAQTQVAQTHMRITTVEWFDMTAKPQVVTSHCYSLDFCRQYWNCNTKTGYREVAGK